MVRTEPSLAGDLDDLDWRLLQLLQQDGRAHVTRLADALRVPRSTVQERMRRLQATGVIRGFTPILDSALLGRPTTAYILVSFQPGTGAMYRKTVPELLAIDGVERADLVAGEWDVILRVRVPSLEALGDMIVERLRTMPIVGRTLTLPSFEGGESFDVDVAKLMKSRATRLAGLA